MEYRLLSTACEYGKDRISADEVNENNYISTENMLPNRGGVEIASSVAEGKTFPAYKEGNILLSNIRPYFKKIWFADKKGGCSNDVLVLKTNKSVDKKFLYYVLSDNNFFNYSTVTSKGTKMPRGSKTAIMKYLVPDVDMPTQKRIADILSAYDDLIENNNRRIALLEKAAQELYKEWFVRFRFPSHENAKFENGLPMGWDVAKLGSILILEDTKRVPLSEQQRSGMQPIYPYYGACSIAGYVDKYIFDGVYLLLSEDGANVVDENGYPTLQYVWGKFWVNNHAHIISKNGVYSVEFLHLLLKNTNMQSIVTGAAQPKISQKRLLNKKVIVPDSKIIKLFSERIDPIYKMIRYISESNRNIEKQRELLLPRLMSGKLEV